MGDTWSVIDRISRTTICLTIGAFCALTFSEYLPTIAATQQIAAAEEKLQTLNNEIDAQSDNLDTTLRNIAVADARLENLRLDMTIDTNMHMLRIMRRHFELNQDKITDQAKQSELELIRIVEEARRQKYQKFKPNDGDGIPKPINELRPKLQEIQKNARNGNGN